MLRNFFIMDEIRGKEEIAISEADVQARIMRMAQARGQDPAVLRGELEQHNIISQLRHDLPDERTRAFLRENAQITEDENL